MAIKNANIWKLQIFKNVKGLLAAPERTLKCVLMDEDAVKLLEIPMATGWVTILEAKLSWMVIQKLKLKMQGSDELVLPISARSYIPLDPLNRLTEAEKKSIVKLDVIASTKYNEAFTRVAENNRTNQGFALLKIVVLAMVVVGSGIMLAFLIKHH